MKIILFTSLLLSFVPLFANAEVQDSCCICLADKGDPASTGNECKRWMKENPKKLGCTYSRTYDDYTNIPKETGLSCDKVTIYGAQHGLSYLLYENMNTIGKLTQNLSPKELSFDASTCMIFNNTEMVKDRAVKLSQSYPNTKFELQANQNTGMVFSLLFVKPKEISTTTSKMMVTAFNGVIDVDYDACSKVGKFCGYAHDDIGALNDPNTKFCKLDNEIVSQSCCLKPGKKDDAIWAQPGIGCYGEKI